MNDRLHPDLLEATRLTKAGRLTEALTVLKRVLGRTVASSPKAETAHADTGRILDLAPEKVEVAERPQQRGSEAASPLRVPQMLQGILERARRTVTQPKPGGLAEPVQAPEPRPAGARFVAGSYDNEAGTRAYKLYVPSSYRGQRLPLIVMLHGCTQSPDDFAAGTGMNGLAEEQGCLVLYPAQDGSANPQRCWNWFSPGDQQRDRGEPSLIAGMARQVMRDYAVDPSRVYAAGLSAGGAAAAILAATYPDLYAAVGIHSGLPVGAASDLPTAFTAMRQGAAVNGRAADRRRLVPAIVFHGDQDGTVNSCNGDHIIAQARAASATLQATAAVQHGQAPGGHAYSRKLHADASGRVMLEQWVIHGAGHAWSGGSPAGSYTDARGPDASREMLRFFLEHPHPAAG